MPQLILFNKPCGVLCQFTGEPGDATLKDYINIPDVYPAGRLDKMSEGLLLLTDDGQLQHRIAHPKFGKMKYYWVQVEGVPATQDLEPIRKGLIHPFLPAQARIIAAPEVWERQPPIRHRKNCPTTWLELIIQEGKNHQVRKMTAAIGFPTLRLIRHRMANWILGDLAPGSWRFADFNSASITD